MVQAILNFLAYLFEKLTGLFGWLLDAIVYIFKAVIWLTIDGVLTSITALISAIDFSVVVFQWSAGWANIPQMGIWLMVNLGFPQFVTIIAGAYALRLALNLIPSWATRA